MKPHAASAEKTPTASDVETGVVTRGPLYWAYIMEETITLVLGTANEQRTRIENIKGVVKRKPEGSWSWMLIDEEIPLLGNEPSRVTAMDAVEKALGLEHSHNQRRNT